MADHTWRPKPTHYSLREGGDWFPWHEVGMSIPGEVHAVKFDDGSIFDTVNGWRPNLPKRRPLTEVELSILDLLVLAIDQTMTQVAGTNGSNYQLCEKLREQLSNLRKDG